VGILYGGELCEVGLVEEVYSPPFHPYTQELLLAVPEIDAAARHRPAPRTDAEGGAAGTTACPFADRCPLKLGPVCEEEPPPWRFTSDTHALRCHIPLEELSRATVWTAEGRRRAVDAPAVSPTPHTDGN
jgi:peptide/nickel transport system ATP-binding protein